MKTRLPRKEKKAMSDQQRLADLKMGIKMKKSAFRIFMHQKYLSKLYNVRITYSAPTYADIKFRAQMLFNPCALREREYACIL